VPNDHIILSVYTYVKRAANGNTVLAGRSIVNQEAILYD
jgi:hypothetical protein